MAQFRPSVKPHASVVFSHDPYSTTGVRILYTPDPKQQLVMATLAAFHTLAYQKDGDVFWSVGSVSTVRLQSMMLASDPDMYTKVVVNEYKGTIQTFLTDVMRANIFFYDAHDFELYPVLAQLISPHEGRCAMLPKATALLLDVDVAQHWTCSVVPRTLSAIAWLSSSNSSSSSGQDPSDHLASGSAPPMHPQRRTTRDTVAQAIALSATFCPFTNLISRNKLKEAVQSAVRQVAQQQQAAAVAEGCCHRDTYYRSETPGVAFHEHSTQLHLSAYG